VVNLEKITTEYSELEDRVRISALTSDNSIIILWASQRMLVMLIPPICEWLDETKSASSQMDRESKKLMNDFAQSQAHAELKPESPVHPKNYESQKKTTPVNSWLIHEIDIKRSDQIIELYFKSTGQIISKLVLTKLAARQWLLILHSQWIKSEWLMNVWPEWFTESSTPAPIGIH
jgi:hypothetical protein